MKSASPTRGVLTLAYGHPRFIEQARDLGLSLQLHAPHLPRALVTDSKDAELLSIFTEIIPLNPDFGSGVRQKLHLDHYSCYDETLFIDSDCLVLGNLDAFWAAFQGACFGVPGWRFIHWGDSDPYMDVNYILERFGVTALPKFNGGTYYFTRTPEARQFFDTARRLMNDWQGLRLNPFRSNGPNDEAVYSIAMAVHRLRPTDMGSGGMWTPCGYRGRLVMDAIAGMCSFEKEGKVRTPEVVHFPGEYIYCFQYNRERARIRKRVLGRRPPTVPLARAYLVSALWQLSRKSEGLSRLARNALRGWRATARSLHARRDNA